MENNKAPAGFVTIMLLKKWLNGLFFKKYKKLDGMISHNKIKMYNPILN